MEFPPTPLPNSVLANCILKTPEPAKFAFWSLGCYSSMSIGHSVSFGPKKEVGPQCDGPATASRPKPSEAIPSSCRVGVFIEVSAVFLYFWCLSRPCLSVCASPINGGSVSSPVFWQVWSGKIGIISGVQALRVTLVMQLQVRKPKFYM